MCPNKHITDLGTVIGEKGARNYAEEEGSKATWPEIMSSNVHDSTFSRQGTVS